MTPTSTSLSVPPPGRLERLRHGFPLPPRGWPLLALLALYVLPGLIGHDPWKTDDATALGVAWDMAVRGHWLSPHLAAQPYPDTPLYYWSAALCGQALSWLLPAHDAARLASGLWVALALFFIRLASRELHGRENSVAGPLVLAGCLGLLIHAHEAQPLLVALAAHAAAWWALALLPRRPWPGGLVFGAALGVAFLGAGFLPLAALAPLAFAAVAMSAQRIEAARALAAGLVPAAALALSWGLALKLNAPADFAAWWASAWAPWNDPAPRWPTFLAYLDLLPWFAWPALPLATWALWVKRRLLREPAQALPLAGFALTLAALSLLPGARSPYALLLLPPLTLLAVPGVVTLRRGAGNAFDWFGIMTFSFFAGLVWVGWSAMVFGAPERLAHQVLRLEPGFVGRFEPLPFILALLATLAWLWMFLSTPRRYPFRGIAHWTAGLALFWLLLMSLWLPWIDYGKSYRAMTAALAKALPANRGCIAERSLGTTQRAAFDYFAGIVTQPDAAARCHWLLTQESSGAQETPPGGGWRKVWEGNRPGDRTERFRLYRRDRKP